MSRSGHVLGSVFVFFLFSLLPISTNAHSLFVEWTKGDVGWISQQDCARFPNVRGVTVPIDYNNESTGKLEVFTFSPKAFDPNKKTVLVIDGGPGAIPSPNRLLAPIALKDHFNLVYYHQRGSGCTYLPLDKDFDSFISTKSMIRDLEKLREAIGIEKWDLVFGMSYGTFMAQVYANHYPQHLDSLVLEGAFVPEVDLERNFWELVPEAILRILQKEKKRFYPMLTKAQAGEIHGLLQKIVADVEEFEKDPRVEKEGLAFYALSDPITWEKKAALIKELSEKFPWLKRGRIFLSALIAGNYSGAEHHDPILAREISSIGIIVVAELFPARVKNQDLERAIEVISGGTVVSSKNQLPKFSYRTFGATRENDKGIEVKSQHHPTFIIVGELDGATPVAQQKIFFDQLVNRGLFLQVQNRGHSRPLRPNCYVEAIGRFLARQFKPLFSGLKMGELGSCKIPSGFKFTSKGL